MCTNLYLDETYIYFERKRVGSWVASRAQGRNVCTGRFPVEEQFGHDETGAGTYSVKLKRV